jgi:hypothetical protein
VVVGAHLPLVYLEVLVAVAQVVQVYRQQINLQVAVQVVL